MTLHIKPGALPGAGALDLNIGVAIAATPAGCAVGIKDMFGAPTYAAFNPRQSNNATSGVGGYPMEFAGLLLSANGDKVRSSGVLELASWALAQVSGAATLIAGVTYFVGDITGKISATPCNWLVPLPVALTASQQVLIQPVGIAISTTRLLIVPGKRVLRQFVAVNPGAITMVRPLWAEEVEGVISQSGAGGGGGRRGATLSARNGGAGGAAGKRFGFRYKCRDIAGTGAVSITNPAAGAGGAPAGADNTSGNVGNNPTASATLFFGAITAVSIGAPLGGAGGTSGVTAGGVSSTGVHAEFWEVMPIDAALNGGSTDGAGNVIGPLANTDGPGQASAGGGITSANAFGSYGPSGYSGSPNLPYISSAGTIGNPAGVNGSDGVAWPRLLGFGTPGGPGGPGILAGGPAGRGGHGGFPGGGGAGGGATLNGFASGAGGNGADGCSLVNWNE